MVNLAYRDRQKLINTDDYKMKSEEEKLKTKRLEFQSQFEDCMKEKEVKDLIHEKVTERYIRMASAGNLTIAHAQLRTFEDSLNRLY